MLGGLLRKKKLFAIRTDRGTASNEAKQVSLSIRADPVQVSEFCLSHATQCQLTTVFGSLNISYQVQTNRPLTSL